jgi:phosphoribosyl-ATP pyrophosphohydrolase
MTGKSIAYLLELERIIEQRKAAAPEQSYTAKLYAAGRSRIAQKVGEEAVELALASMQDDRQRTLSEAADLVYHLIVLLRYHDLSLGDVAGELGRRQR